ncbi:MAG: hypothetical protein WCT22_00255 [Patescibacteria group bacterium]
MSDPIPVGEAARPAVNKASESPNNGSVTEAEKLQILKKSVGVLYGERKARPFKSKGPKLSGLKANAEWMKSDEVKKMGVGATLVQGKDKEETKKPEEDDKKKDETPPPAPVPEKKDETPPPPPPEVFTPPALASEIGLGVVTDPTRIEQEIGTLAEHDRAREKPARGFLGSLATPIAHPGEFIRNFVQNTLFKENFDRRSRSFSKTMMQIARAELSGLDTSIPFEMPKEILNEAIAKGREARKKDNVLKRFGWTLRDTFSGLTAVGQNSDMIYAERWFKENGKELVTEAKKKSLGEQTELGERFAIKGENKDVISADVGEVRHTLESAITDEPTKKLFQTTLKQFISEYVQNPNDEALLKKFNAFYHEKIFPKIAPDKQKEIEGTELSSNILKIAKGMLVEDQVGVDQFKSRYQRYQDEKVEESDKSKWEELHFDVYLGRGKYEVTRGDVRLSGIEKEIIHRMVESDYKVANDRLGDRAWQIVKDVGIYGIAYAAGGKGAGIMVGKSFLGVGGMVTGSVVAGAREGVLLSSKGRLFGFRGKSVTDFEQVSREKSQGRENLEKAKLRPQFEKAMVDQVEANDLTQPIFDLLTKEGDLTLEEQKLLFQSIAHAKARMKLTDLSTKKGKFLEVSVAQNFIRYHEDTRNAEMTAMRAAIVKGVAKLSATNPELYAKMDDCQAVYEAQLRVGSFQDKVIASLAKNLKITPDEARTRFGDFYEELGIDNKDRKSLEAAAFTLAKLVDTKALTTMGIAAAVSPIIGTEMHIIGEGFNFGKHVFAGDVSTWLTDWGMVKGGDIPLTYNDKSDLVSHLSPLQKDVLWWHNVIKPPPIMPHEEMIDGTRVVLPGGVQHGFYIDKDGVQHTNADALVDSRTGEVLVHMDHSTLFYNEKGELMVRNDDNGGSKLAEEVADFTKNGIHLIHDPNLDKVSQGGNEKIFEAGSLHEDSSVVVNGKNITTTIPENTYWQHDKETPGTWELVGKNTDGTTTTLIDHATIRPNGQIEGADYHTTVTPPDYITGGETTTTADLWGDISKHNYRIVWGESLNIKPDHNSVFFTGDGTGSGEHSRGIQITFEDDQIRNPNVINPNFGNGGLTTLSQEFDKGHMAVLFEVRGLHGVGDGQILVKQDAFDELPNGQFALNLDPANTTRMVTIVDGANEIKISMAELAQNILNEKAIGDLPQGKLDSEFYGKFDVFNLGNEGKNGIINMGYITDANWLKNEKYGADFENIGAGGEKLFIPVHMMSGSNDINNTPVDISGGEPNYQATITVDDIVNSIAGKTLLGYKIEYDNNNNWPPFLVPVPARQNIEKSVRGEQASSPPPLIYSPSSNVVSKKPGTQVKEETQVEKDEARKRLITVNYGTDDKKELTGILETKKSELAAIRQVLKSNLEEDEDGKAKALQEYRKLEKEVVDLEKFLGIKSEAEQTPAVLPVLKVEDFKGEEEKEGTVNGATQLKRYSKDGPYLDFEVYEKDGKLFLRSQKQNAKNPMKVIYQNGGVNDIKANDGFLIKAGEEGDIIYYDNEFYFINSDKALEKRKITDRERLEKLLAQG